MTVSPFFNVSCERRQVWRNDLLSFVVVAATALSGCEPAGEGPDSEVSPNISTHSQDSGNTEGSSAPSEPTDHEGAATSASPPRAPNIDWVERLYGEDVKQIELAPGERTEIEVKKLWVWPAFGEPSCSGAYVVFTWMVRKPYPDGGNDLDLRQPVPQAMGRTEKVDGGASGQSSAGYCSSLIFVNAGLEPYTIEIRYASGATYFVELE